MGTTSLNEIAQIMDTEFPEVSLAGLLSQHRLSFSGGAESRAVSLGELCERHEASTTIKLLFQNTFLLTAGDSRIACTYKFLPDIVIQDFSVSSKPAIEQRAPEFGRKLADTGAHLVALSEVFKDEVRDDLLDGWRSSAPLAQWDQGPAAQSGLPDVPLPFPLCPPNLVGIPLPPVLQAELGNSGLLTVVRQHSVVDVARVRFDNAGHVLRDIDALSSKGVLKVSIDIGVGVLSIFSTHIYNGGHSILEATEDHRDSVKQSQFEQTASMIEEEQRLHPERVCILGGDFNRDGSDNSDVRYQRLAAIMSGAGMRDLWDQRATDEVGNPTNGSTSIAETDITETRRLCPVTARSDIYCDERVTNSGVGRIDYIFVQTPTVTHTFDIELQRPRRIYFEMDSPIEGMRYLSDHLGLETVIFARPR